MRSISRNEFKGDSHINNPRKWKPLQPKTEFPGVYVNRASEFPEFIGMEFDAALEKQFIKKFGAYSYRILYPRSKPVDFSPMRINVHLDPHNRVVAISRF